MLLTSCATPRLDIPRGQEVRFSVVASGPSGDGIQISNKTPMHDARIGAKGGGLAGMAVGLGCGPYALFCMPVTGLAGMLAGGLAGYGVGAIESWPSERVEQMQDRLNRFRQSHAPLDALNSLLLERASKHWKIDGDASATSVEIQLVQVSVHTTRDERAALAATIRVTVQTPQDRLHNTLSSRQLDYLGPYISSRAWIDASDEVLANSFRAVYLHLADAVFSELGAH